MSPSRTWIKLYCEKWLKGTLRQETRQFRGDWADIMALAGGLTYGEDGIIKLADGVGLSDEQIAAILHIEVEEWLTTKQRLLATERISIDGDNIIKITNWSEYQSEYGRQKTYRQSPQPEEQPAPKDFKAFIKELRPKYPDLDMDEEWEDCQRWWREEHKEMKHPKQAFKNWLKGAKPKQGTSSPAAEDKGKHTAEDDWHTPTLD